MKLRPLLSPLLGPLGFRSVTDEIYLSEATSEISGWLGFSKATKRTQKGEFDLFPSVGLRFERINEIVGEWRPVLRRPSAQTVSVPLTVLMRPQYRVWFFTPSDYEERAQELVADLVQWGLPFIRSCGSLGDLCRMFEHHGYSQQWVYVRPVAYWLAGEGSAAAVALADEERRIGERTDQAAIDFRAFAAQLRARAGL